MTWTRLLRNFPHDLSALQQHGLRGCPALWLATMMTASYEEKESRGRRYLWAVQQLRTCAGRGTVPLQRLSSRPLSQRLALQRTGWGSPSGRLRSRATAVRPPHFLAAPRVETSLKGVKINVLAAIDIIAWPNTADQPSAADQVMSM